MQFCPVNLLSGSCNCNPHRMEFQAEQQSSSRSEPFVELLVEAAVGSLFFEKRMPRQRFRQSDKSKGSTMVNVEVFWPIHPAARPWKAGYEIQAVIAWPSALNPVKPDGESLLFLRAWLLFGKDP